MLKPALAIFSMVASCKLPLGSPNRNFLLIAWFRFSGFKKTVAGMGKQGGVSARFWTAATSCRFGSSVLR
jgi:hypothetical protein